MTNETDLTCIFIGSMVDVKYYKEQLEKLGISSMWKDEFSSGTIVGIGGTPDSVELLVEEADAERGRKCIENLQANEE